MGTGDRHRAINQNNLSIISIYFSVRHCIPADWLNDRDEQDGSQLEMFEPSQKSLIPTQPLQFSEEAQAVFDAGRELWRYYHAQENANANASLYDIRKFFQGENEKGHMNKTSEDEQYNLLIATLREKLKDLADKIKPKVFEYGFLRR